MFKINFNKYKFITITLIVCIILLIGFGSIAYSALNSTMRVEGSAYARVEKDIRITDFRLASTNNATSSYEEFGISHVVTEIDLVNSSSSITYYLEITNYGSVDVGIFNITGLPSNVNYSIKDYNLKDKICDDGGKCNGFITKTYEITFTTSSTYKGNLQLNFEFRRFYNITYVGLSGSYINEFIAGDKVSIDFSLEPNKFIYAIGEEDFDYFIESNYVYSFSNAFCDVEMGIIEKKDFDYTGDVQTYKILADGVYKIELWGAQGGLSGGLGAYTSGYISLEKDEVLYFYVGGSGVTNIQESTEYFYNEFNCGGVITGQPGQSRVWGTGGASTDVRLVSGLWNNFDSLKSRIMVAAGGGGSYASPSVYNGGAGGGLVGYDGLPVSGFTNSSWGSAGYGATQIRPGYNVINSSSDPFYIQGYTNEKYGFGGFGSCGNGNVTNLAAGGGSGYYGGGSSTHIQSAGGGSSFISWHDGCDAITANSTSSNIVHTGKSNHYSGHAFCDTTMIDGNGYKWTDSKETSVSNMPTHDGTGTMIGNSGNGYAKITPIELGYGYVTKFTNVNNIGYECYGTIPHSSAGVAWKFGAGLYPNIKVYNIDGSEHTDYIYNETTGSVTVFKPFENIEFRAEN